uniref:Uncharacterized protein n=1 Tax=Dikerogammarus haemobaphes virus 1 TaxID=2704946 RepID=A0A6G9HDG2_9VIRU|nr:hypothetical protein [Dikerogammarus haemobaphes virus 1]
MGRGASGSAVMRGKRKNTADRGVTKRPSVETSMAKDDGCNFEDIDNLLATVRGASDRDESFNENANISKRSEGAGKVIENEDDTVAEDDVGEESYGEDEGVEEEEIGEGEEEEIGEGEEEEIGEEEEEEEEGQLVKKAPIRVHLGDEDFSNQLNNEVSERKKVPGNILTKAVFEHRGRGKGDKLTLTYVAMSKCGSSEETIQFNSNIDKFSFKKRSGPNPCYSISCFDSNKMTALGGLWFNFTTRLVNATTKDIKEPFFSILRTDAPDIAAIVDYFDTHQPIPLNDENAIVGTNPYISVNLDPKRWYTVKNDNINPKDYIGQMVECLAMIDFTFYTKKTTTGRFGVKPYLTTGRLRIGEENIPQFND